MNINLDEKKIKNIVYLTRNGRPVNLVLKNGELVDITDIPVKYKTDIERENAWVKDTLTIEDLPYVRIIAAFVGVS